MQIFDFAELCIVDLRHTVLRIFLKSLLYHFLQFIKLAYLQVNILESRQCKKKMHENFSILLCHFQ